MHLKVYPFHSNLALFINEMKEKNDWPYTKNIFISQEELGHIKNYTQFQTTFFGPETCNLTIGTKCHPNYFITFQVFFFVYLYTKHFGDNMKGGRAFPMTYRKIFLISDH